MRTTIYNKVKRVAVLALLGVAMAPTVQAQEALHLFYKNGAREQLPITEDTYVEFVRQPYLEASWNGTDTIHLSASSGRSSDLGYVHSNVEYDLSTDNDWLLVRKGNDSQKIGDGMHEDYFVIYSTANASDQPRYGKVKVASRKGGLTKEFVVMQHPYMLTLSNEHFWGNYEVPITNKTVVLAWNDTIYNAVAYPNHGVNILTYPKWMKLIHKVDGDDHCKFEDILNVESAQQAGQDTETYARFSFAENRTPNDRTGNIIFEANGETAVLTVTQKGLTDETSLAPLRAIQTGMLEATDHDAFSHMSTLHATDMMAEDMMMFNVYVQLFSWDYEHTNNGAGYRRNKHLWDTYYKIVVGANTTIDLIAQVKELVGNEEFVLGNAYAYRAMAYLYLIQLFQDPTTENGINELLPGVPMLYAETEQAGMSSEQIEYFKGRNTVGEVMAQIEADITRAIELLHGKVRPSKNFIDVTVAQGIAARYYLLAQEWEKAATMANAARNTYRLMDGNTETNGIRDGFMDITNEEWMWGFDHTPETQTTYASFFSHISNLTPGYSGLAYTGRGIDVRLYGMMSDTDYRKIYWYNDAEGNTQATVARETAGSKLPLAILKHGWDGTWTMDYLYMRAAEMVLIEAEAYTQMGWSTDAANALAELMVRRDPNWQAYYPTIEDIYLQRRLELIGEGHAYFDLKRLNKGIERDYEGSNHLDGYKLNVAAEDTAWTYKIPQSAINDDRTYNLTEEDNLFRK